MKSQQHEQAKDLYFQNLSKTEIADRLNVNRRTVLLWSQQGNWDQLRKSSQHMPSLIAEKMYYLLDQYVSNLLSEGSVISTFGIKQAQTINLLATSIKKIKNRSTTNESMELLTFFHEGLKRRDPQLAEDILPHMETYINCRASASTTDFLMDGFNKDATLPISDKELQEQWQDERDHEILMDEYAAFIESRNTPPPSAAPATQQPTPTPPPSTPHAQTATTPSTTTPPSPSESLPADRHGAGERSELFQEFLKQRAAKNQSPQPIESTDQQPNNPTNRTIPNPNPNHDNSELKKSA